MNAEARLWLTYAGENERSAGILLAQALYNPCLQNAQQAIEKYLKAALVEKGMPVKRTHSIRELAEQTRRAGIELPLSDDDADLIDSIFLPSRYPVGSALPDFNPDAGICRRCMEIASAVAKKVRQSIGG